MPILAPASVTQPPRVRRMVSLLAVSCAVLIAYGSLVPLNPAALTPGEAWARFSGIPFLSIGPGRRADWVANILLFVPLSFLWCARSRLRKRPRRGSAIMAIAACMAFALLLEFVQLWFPPRTVSQNDIIAEWIGSAIGAAVWLLWGNRILAAGARIAGGGAAGLAAALGAYGGAYAIFVLLPFDFVISAAELEARLDRASVAPLLSPWCGGVLRCGIKLSIETAALVPIGFLIALMARRRNGPPAGVLAGAAIGALAGIAIELCQIFLVSGIAQGISVATRAGGVAIGVALGRRWDPGWTAYWARIGRPLLVLAALCHALAIAALFGRGGWDLEGATARLHALSWLPFYYHYYTSEQGALVSLLSNAALYAPIGAGLFLWRFAAAGGRHTSLPLPGAAAAASAAALLAVAVEGARLLKESGHADPTNILLAAIAAPLAFHAAGWLAACLFEGPPKTARP